MLNFKDLYKASIDSLKEEFGYTNIHQVPKIEKVVLSMGIGGQDKKFLEGAVHDLGLIAGQKAIFTKAKKSIAAFKTREGDIVGCKVTLRGDKMYYFLQKLVMIVMPRQRDFKGFYINNFDGNGSLSFGIKERVLFPEIKYNEAYETYVNRGLNITVVTTATTDSECRGLLQKFYFPFNG